METRTGRSIPAVVTELPDMEIVSSYLTVPAYTPKDCTSPICHNITQRSDSVGHRSPDFPSANWTSSLQALLSK